MDYPPKEPGRDKYLCKDSSLRSMHTIRVLPSGRKGDLFFIAIIVLILLYLIILALK